MSRRANHGDKHRGAYARSHQTDGTHIEICSCGVERLAKTVNGRTQGLTGWMKRIELEAIAHPGVEVIERDMAEWRRRDVGSKYFAKVVTVYSAWQCEHYHHTREAALKCGTKHVKKMQRK